MLKYLVVVMIVSQLSEAQKSFYAGQQSWYPKVLAKYRTTTTTTTESLANRVNENTMSVEPENLTPTQEPEEAVSDYDRYIQRISSWPVDKQPFWYKNREAIAAMINQQVDAGNRQGQQQPSGSPFAGNMRSPFAGQSRRW